MKKFVTIFSAFYLLAFFPDIYFLFLNWMGYEALHVGQTAMRTTYNFLFDISQTILVWLLWLQLTKKDRDFIILFLMFIPTIILELYIFNKFNHFYVYRSVEMMREIACIIPLFIIAWNMPDENRNLKMAWIAFNIFNISNFICIVLWKIVYNQTAPISFSYVMATGAVTLALLSEWLIPGAIFNRFRKRGCDVRP